MQIKNKIISIILGFLTSFLFVLNISAEEFNISAEEIIIDKLNNIVIGSGSVEATDIQGRVIKANKITYKKSEEFLIAEGSVQVYDIDGNILKTDKATYNKPEEIIITYQNSELILKEGYNVSTNKIFYDGIKKIIHTDQNAILRDVDGNLVKVDMFQYNIQKNIFSSIGKIKIIDVKKNKYFFKELFVDTKKHEMIGSEASAILDQENFGLSKENDPRFVANQVFMTKNETNLLKGVFTVCHNKKDKCPPWSLQAKKIRHDKIKKTIYYDQAILKVYGIPVFYFPKFIHPDPTVKRQSGFLYPLFSNATAVGTGFALPYYWAINNDKDLTFAPKIYANENILFLNEYRQAFKKGFLTLDTSYTEGYKQINSTKTGGSRNHIFADLYLKLSQDNSYNSDLSFKIQRTSNDTYFRVHDINTELVDSENTNLENVINYNFSKDNMYLNISGALYEDLRVNTNNRYEYILPNIMYGKTFFSEKSGSIDFKSNALYKNYDTNKHLTFLTNDLIWTSNNYTTKGGIVNALKGIITNKNYEAKNTPDHKTDKIVNEMKSVLTFKSSLPMKKENTRISNIFIPNFMIRYAPGHMRNLRSDNVTLKYENLFSTNKTSDIENGLSAILGFDFKKNEKKRDGIDREKFALSIGQVFRSEKNEDLPRKSSLDQKMSDIVGELNYNFSKIGKIGYKFSIDHNINDLNYNEISSNFNFGKVNFNLDYLEEQNHVGDEHYVNAGISLNLNDNNKLSVESKKNFKTDSTELYNVSYQYINDCLAAGLVFRREFYEDNDIEQKDSLIFQITFTPFGGVKTPSIINP